MSLLGIDIGSSGVKVAAFREDGRRLAALRTPIEARHPRPGQWEVDPDAVWRAVLDTVRAIGARREVGEDPPRALAVAASGREVFPVDAAGKPLGPSLMAGDVRGSDLATELLDRRSRAQWLGRCGHLPERMDPIARILWWKAAQPEIFGRSARFLGWHELVAMRLAGSAVTDPSLAAKWLAYDLDSGAWSRELLDEVELDPGLLPEIQPWGTVVGELGGPEAAELGLAGMPLAVGGFDASCAVLGAGATGPRAPGLVVGSWEGLVVPALPGASEAATDLPPGASVGPHPGQGQACFALSPNGMSAVDWACRIGGVSLERLNDATPMGGHEPSPIVAVPWLSGSMNAADPDLAQGGALLGLTLNTSGEDIVRAVMEGIAIELMGTVTSLRHLGFDPTVIRATGGGTRARWWMQLKADLLGVPIEVAAEPEAGTLAACALAGLAVDAYTTLEELREAFGATRERFEPDEMRGRRWREHIDIYAAHGASRAGARAHASPSAR